ncbi:MoaD/ThiS family protein [Sphingomonas ginkgonis]|uniref:MoaD/ThiS family protein n=1 Tax=Sphingomonas ginkgonis TaxID=2315330 RepID=A0A429V6H7_9SPHN|nr:MoaD/ThiS family protein [Sphingomonas ginkgonis]RST29542.1 MoaD/ThiS family protein [Sphingomonas ginkgonis]
MRLTLVFFGRLADVAGRELPFDSAARNVGGLRRELAGRFPGLAEDLLGSRVRICIADSLVSDDEALHDGQRLDILSPLSGG